MTKTWVSMDANNDQKVTRTYEYIKQAWKKNTHTHTHSSDYDVAEVEPNRQCMKRMWRWVWVCIDDVRVFIGVGNIGCY